jgi:hypothetical protein
MHQPGDALTPSECGGRPVRVEITLPGEAPQTVDVFPISLGEPGAAAVLLEDADDPTCQLSMPFTIARPTIVPSDGRPGGSVRDLDARLGAAFVVGDRGVYAVRERWFDLRDMTDGAPDNLQAVRVYEGLPHVGPRDATSEFFRVHTDDALASLGHDALFIHMDDSETRALARERSGLRLLLATKSGLYEWDGTSARSINGRDIERGGAVALSSMTIPLQGDVWAINPDGDLYNYSTTGGDRVADTTVDVGTPADIELDEATGSRLWICGSERLALYERAGSTLGGALTRPRLDCRDLAPARDGGVWAATSNGLERYDSDGVQRSLLPLAGGATHVATAFTADTRETWVLRGDRSMFVLRATP